MNRVPFIAGNWKMYKTGTEAVSTVKELKTLVSGVTGVDIMIAPTFVSLPLVVPILKEAGIFSGAQNLFYEKEGAFTGEISAPMLKDCGVDYVIIGHSERRQFFNDTDETVNLKMKAAIQAGLSPVLCVGETELERDEEKTFSILDKQVSNGLKGFGSDELKDLVVAYEPVWAIGTGKTATADQVNEVHAYLRSLLARLYPGELPESTRIVYGGSVKPGNIKELMDGKDVDGALVGGASLEAETFYNIINFEN